MSIWGAQLWPWQETLLILYDGVERFGYLYDIFICSSDLKIKTLHTGSRKWISHVVPVFLATMRVCPNHESVVDVHFESQRATILTAFKPRTFGHFPSTQVQPLSKFSQSKTRSQHDNLSQSSLTVNQLQPKTSRLSLGCDRLFSSLRSTIPWRSVRFKVGTLHELLNTV